MMTVDNTVDVRVLWQRYSQLVFRLQDWQLVFDCKDSLTS